MFHCGIHLLLLVVAATYMAWSNEDHRAEVGGCLWLQSWWLWGVLDFFLGGEPKGTLVDCSWLVWSSSCVGCVAPYWGFGMWCQLAREPPSEWITTTRTSLLASKWTSVKNHCVHHLIVRWLVFIIVIDWFIPRLDGITNLLSLFTLPQTNCQAL